MLDFLPFSSESEQRLYCEYAGVPFEEGSIGFKGFDGEKKCALIQIKLVSDAAYVLTVLSLDKSVTEQILANLLKAVTGFLRVLGVKSVIFPTESEREKRLGEMAEFDRVSDTLYLFDFPEEQKQCAGHDGHCHCHDCDE